MSSVYEVIDELRERKHLSVRKLAIIAGMPPSTLVSILDRRSVKLSKERLGAIANALGVEWTDLVNEAASKARTYKVSMALTEEEKKCIVEKIMSPSPKNNSKSSSTQTQKSDRLLQDFLQPLLGLSHEEYDSLFTVPSQLKGKTELELLREYIRQIQIIRR